jgi:hypothetical protein
LGVGVLSPVSSRSVGPVSSTGSGSRSFSRNAFSSPVSLRGGSPSSFFLLSGSGSSLILLSFLRVTVEEHINHDIPGGVVLESTTETENLAGQEPVDQTKSMLTLVVSGDGNINELQKRVSVSERDDRDVDIGRFLDSLRIRTRVGANNQTRLSEGASDVVGEGTGGETTDDSLSANVLCELQSSTVTIRTSGDNDDVMGLIPKICISTIISSTSSKLAFTECGLNAMQDLRFQW